MSEGYRRPPTLALGSLGRFLKPMGRSRTILTDSTAMIAPPSNRTRYPVGEIFRQRAAIVLIAWTTTPATVNDDGGLTTVREQEDARRLAGGGGVQFMPPARRTPLGRGAPMAKAIRDKIFSAL